MGCIQSHSIGLLGKPLRLFFDDIYIYIYISQLKAVATGATLCYLISAALAPALLSLPKWKARLDRWAERVEDQRANLISFLVVLRYVFLKSNLLFVFFSFRKGNECSSEMLSEVVV